MRTETAKDHDTPATTKSVLADIESLAALREELRLQAHLLRAEARERFEALEHSWQEVERVGRAVEHESSDAAKRIARVGKEMIAELRTEYRRLKAQIASH